MKYVKSCLIITMLLGIGYSQCDANGDGDLDILDILVEVNCILTPGCWEGEPVCADCGDSECCDCDGNVYETIQIGNQLWMAENLKVTHYNDGSEIQYVQQESSEPNVWENLSTGAYGYYDDDLTHQETYGNLYNWYTVDDDRGVCPEGWHVPADAEYTILTDYLGGTSVAGGKMKEEGHEHWNYYSDEITEEATNESGFTGLPASYRNGSGGSYNDMGYVGTFWSSSETSSDVAWGRDLDYYGSDVFRYSISKQFGFSIRCLGD